MPACSFVAVLGSLRPEDGKLAKREGLAKLSAACISHLSMEATAAPTGFPNLGQPGSGPSIASLARAQVD